MSNTPATPAKPATAKELRMRLVDAVFSSASRLTVKCGYHTFSVQSIQVANVDPAYRNDDGGITLIIDKIELAKVVAQGCLSALQSLAPSPETIAENVLR